MVESRAWLVSFQRRVGNTCQQIFLPSLIDAMRQIIDSISVLYCKHPAHIRVSQCIQLAIRESLCSVHDAVWTLAKDLLHLHTSIQSLFFSQIESWPAHTQTWLSELGSLADDSGKTDNNDVNDRLQPCYRDLCTAWQHIRDIALSTSIETHLCTTAIS